MKVETSWTSKKDGKLIKGFYEDVDDFSHLPKDKVRSVAAFCYLNGQILIVKNEGNWEPVAGHVEAGESLEEALVREVKEESNMKVLKSFPVGYLYTYDHDIYQARYLCVVEPYGEFLKDPAGEVTEIKPVKPAEIFDYVKWVDTSRLMADKCQKIINLLL